MGLLPVVACVTVGLVFVVTCVTVGLAFVVTCVTTGLVFVVSRMGDGLVLAVAFFAVGLFSLALMGSWDFVTKHTGHSQDLLLCGILFLPRQDKWENFPFVQSEFAHFTS